MQGDITDQVVDAVVNAEVRFVLFSADVHAAFASYVTPA